MRTADWLLPAWRAGAAAPRKQHPGSSNQEAVPRKLASASPPVRSKRSIRAWHTLPSEVFPLTTPSSSAAPRSLFDKLWAAHVVCHEEPQPALLYIDLHLVHEVTSPQAFEGLRVAGRTVRRPDLTFGT